MFIMYNANLIGIFVHIYFVYNSIEYVTHFVVLLLYF